MSHQTCYHCGDEVIGKGIQFDQKFFCCQGCKSVFQLLSENNLRTFYNLETKAGLKPTESNLFKYSFLEIESIKKKFIDFQNENTCRITLFLPQIHCSSCIYLLENLHKIEPAIISSDINFAKREATIVFNNHEISLAQLAQLLDKIGYAPNFGNRKQTDKKRDITLLYKLGVSGFAFGSIMLWSFPEYLGIDKDNPEFRNFTSYLSLAVSIPVIVYAASDYFISAFKALRYKSLNLDVPITIGIIALYAQSSYSIISGEGPGYMDSFAGFIFFLLIGKWFQNKTYHSLSFERDYTSYFPVAVTKLDQNQEDIVEIESLRIGNTIIIRNEEVIPCDSLLISDHAKIDYSFVTGESKPIDKLKGDFIYAGGKLLGQRAILCVENETKRSHLTQLWNDVKSAKKETTRFAYQDKLSFYFLIVILFIASVAGIYWAFIDWQKITHIIVSILIVACPCALALSAPFTYGNIMRLLGRKGLYLKNTRVIERINSVTDIVFDKTGTLTTGVTDQVTYLGDELSENEKKALYCLVQSSTHPLSRAIAKHLSKIGMQSNSYIEAFEENMGQGISGSVENIFIKVGSAEFTNQSISDSDETSSYITFDNGKKGRFVFNSEIRPGISTLMSKLSNYHLHVLSGDSTKDKQTINSFFPEGSRLLFEQSPKDKLQYIESLKKESRKILMIGDGLNDSGALGISDVGIAVSEDIFRFTPSSDAIIEASKLANLDKLLSISSFSKRVLLVCLLFSLAYNIIGLSFAISGHLTPLVAAILMPISSITVVFLSTILIVSKKNK